MKQIELTVPACIILSKKKGAKKYYLNLNNYRNWHYQINNQIKKKFKQIIHEEMALLPRIKFIHSLQYELIITNKRKRDRMNIYSIVDKFFCDALQEYNKIEDDSDSFIGDFIFKPTFYIKDKPENIRVMITILFE